MSKIGGAIFNAGKVPPKVRAGLTFSNLPAARDALLKRATEQIHSMLPEYRPRILGICYDSTKNWSGATRGFQWPVTGERVPNVETSYE
jgi:hypothetical protein